MRDCVDIYYLIDDRKVCADYCKKFNENLECE